MNEDLLVFHQRVFMFLLLSSGSNVETNLCCLPPYRQINIIDILRFAITHKVCQKLDLNL